MCRETTIINERVGEEKSRSTAPILSHRSQFDLDVVGHDSRPDVLRLEVNEQPMKSVWFR
jgi:hypothetical protein